MEIDHQTLRQIIKEELDNVLKEQKQKILSGEEFESLSAEQQLKYGRSIGWRTGVFGNRVIVGAKDYRIQGKKHPVKYTKEQFMAVKFAKTDAENELEGALSGDLSKIPSWLPWLKELINSGQVTNDNLIGAGGDLIRQKWIENADMSYFNSFVYVHGAIGSASRLKAIADGGMNTGSDISVIGYPSSGVVGKTWGNVGLILEGKVVQAFGSDGNTDNFIGGRSGLAARSSSDVNVKYTGKPGTLITNRESHSKHAANQAINEAILNDWKVVGIIVQNPDGVNSSPEAEQNKAILQDLMTKYKLFDKNFKEVKTLEEAGVK